MSISERLNKSVSERFPVDSIRKFFGTITVPNHKYTFWYLWGGVSILFLLTQIITGLLLTLYYVPTIEDSNMSIQYISDKIEFGSLIRSMHYWSAHGLIFSVSVHLLSSFFMRAYRKPRELMWLSGITLLFILLASAFTGEILPWHELSYFGAVVGISQIEKIPIAGGYLALLLKGSHSIGSESLTRFYSLHTVILPLSIILFFILHSALGHIFRISTPPDAKIKGEPIKFYFNFSYRIIIAMLISLAALTVVSVLLPVGYGKGYDMMNPTEAPPGIHPEWYFMWIFQALKADAIVPGFVAAIFLLLIILFWVCVPFIERRFAGGRSNSAINIIGIMFMIFAIVLTVWGYLQSGISFSYFTQFNALATGGIDRFSFLGIVLFLILIMIFLIFQRMKSAERKEP